MTRIGLGIIGGDAPVGAYRDMAAAALYADVPEAEVRRLLENVLPGGTASA